MLELQPNCGCCDRDLPPGTERRLEPHPGCPGSMAQ